MFAPLVKIPNTKEVISLTDFLCTLKKEGSGYSLELSFDNIKAALDAALEILAFADADCYLASHSEEEPKTSPPSQV